MKILHSTTIIAVLIISTSTSPAFSQENGEDTSTRSISIGIGFPEFPQPFQAKIGLGIGPFPEYEGADDYAAKALPLINIRKPGSYFIRGASINTNDGLASAGLTLLHFSYVEESRHRMQIVIGPLIRTYGGWDESDSDVLSGLDDIDRSVGMGGFIEFSTAKQS